MFYGRCLKGQNVLRSFASIPIAKILTFKMFIMLSEWLVMTGLIQYLFWIGSPVFIRNQEM
jgi:hypothetical protein